METHLIILLCATIPILWMPCVSEHSDESLSEVDEQFTKDWGRQLNAQENQSDMRKTNELKESNEYIVIETREQPKDAQLLKQYQMDCVEDVKVDPDLVIRFKAGDWRNDQPPLKRWVLCILIKMGLMSPEGVYRFDEAMSRLTDKDKPKAEQLIDGCLSSKAMPPIDIAWSYVHCLHARDPLGNFSSLSILSP